MKDGWPHSIQPQLKDFPENSVAIVMCVRDNLKFFKLAFHSVMSFTAHPFHFVIIDNLGSFTTKNYLKRLQKNHPICVMPFNQDFNFAAQLNFGFNYSFTFPQIKYGVALHSDVVVEPNWMNKILGRFTFDKKPGCVVPANGEHWLAFRRETFSEIKGFDDKYKGHGYVVQDFCRRAKKENWECVMESDTDVHHFYQTQMREGLVTNHHLENDRGLFFSKFPELATHSLESRQGEKV